MSSKPRDIPGYYYDEVKKKYFKITKDFKPPRKKFEEKNEKDREKRRKHCYNNIYGYIQQREYGISISSKDRILQRTTLQGMEQLNPEIFSCPEIFPSFSSGVDFKSGKAESSGEAIVMEDHIGHMWYCEVEETKRKKIDIRVEFELPISFWVLEKGHISSYQAVDDCGFICAVQHENTNNGLIKDSSVFEFGRHPLCQRQFSNYVITSVAKFRDALEYLVGLATQKIRYVTNSRYHFIEQWEMTSVPHVMVPFKQNKHVALIGCENGEIKFLDIRSKNIQNTKFTSQCRRNNFRIDHIEILSNGFQFVASDWNAQLRLYDIRKSNGIIREYKGHVNNHSARSFSISSNHLYAVGTDNILRSWNLASSELTAEVSISTYNSIYTPFTVFLNNFGLIYCAKQYYKYMPMA